MNLFREPLFIYIVVFAAIVLPVAFYVFSRDDQSSLPGMGKITTQPACLNLHWANRWRISCRGGQGNTNAPYTLQG